MMTRNKEEREELGERLKEARRYRGFSQKEIANYLGISEPTLSLIERGEKEIEPAKLQKLADFYNTTVDELTDGVELKRDNEEIELLARATQDFSSQDRKEVLRFAEFLKAREPEGQEDD